MAQLKRCLHCGTVLDTDDRYCLQCGRQTAGKKHLTAAVAAVLVLLCVAAGGGYWYTFGRGGVPSSPAAGQQQAAPAAATPATAEQAAAPQAPPEANKKLGDPRTYLPALHTQQTVFQRFADGEEGTMEFITAQVSGAAVVSQVEIVRPPGEGPLGFVQHFLLRRDGVYTVDDANLGQPELWLQNDLRPGRQWEEHGVRARVVRSGVPCDVGFRVFQDCLVVERHYPEAGGHYECYYAPGQGLVLKKDLQNGQTVYCLRAIASLEAPRAEEAVRRYAPNRGLVK